MHTPELIAKHFLEVHTGGNWTWANLKEVLSDISWKEATTKIDSMNTIAALVFHTNYFVRAVLMVLNNKPLEAHDKYSFDLPPVNNTDDWEKLKEQSWKDADEFVKLTGQLPESRLWEIFAEAKYGNYFRNLLGVIEHTHYHLGQIVILKKMIQNKP